jgi:ankyrin repeat protein
MAQLKTRLPAAKKGKKMLNEELWDEILITNNSGIERLINRGADIASKHGSGRTVFHRAAYWGRTQTCALLLAKYSEKGGNIKQLIEEQDIAGKSALHEATAGGYTDTAAFLTLCLIGAEPMKASAFISDFRACVGH